MSDPALLTPPATGCGDDETVEVAPNLVPDIDQESPVATYPDWRHEDTKVVTYQIGLIPPTKTSDHWAVGRPQAKADAETRYGRVYEANYVPGRAFFRVKR